MPLDTSIPLQIGRGPQVQAIDPMTIYNAMQERQMNALRAQALQQDMARNAMLMQNSIEDRRAAAATAAQERARVAELRNMLASATSPAAVGARGAGYSGTGVSTDPYAGLVPKLVSSGFLDQAANIAELSNKQATGRKTAAETVGVLTDNQKKQIEATDAQLKQASVSIGSALSPEAVHAIYKANPAALAVRGMTPDKAIEIFNQKVREVGFDRARMEVERGIFDTAKQLSDEIKILESPQGQFAYTPRTNTTQRITAPTGEPVMAADKRTIGYEPASEAVLKKSGESLVEEEKALRNAPLDIDNLEKAKALIPQAKTFMGPGGELRMDVVSFFNNTFGTQISTEGIRTAQDLEARLFKGVMDNLKKMDSQPTQQQQEALRKALGQLKNDPNALNDIITTMQDAIRARVDLHNSRVQQAKERGVQGAYNLDIKLAPKSSASAVDSLSVTTPNGKVYSFPTPEAAAQFKKAAGIP